MPIRFSTEAANEDILGEDPAPAATADGAPTSRDERSSGRQSRTGEAKPGKDINAAGFVKDKDSGKP